MDEEKRIFSNLISLLGYILFVFLATLTGEILVVQNLDLIITNLDNILYAVLISSFLLFPWALKIGNSKKIKKIHKGITVLILLGLLMAGIYFPIEQIIIRNWELITNKIILPPTIILLGMLPFVTFVIFSLFVSAETQSGKISPFYRILLAPTICFIPLLAGSLFVSNFLKMGEWRYNHLLIMIEATILVALFDNLKHIAFLARGKEAEDTLIHRFNIWQIFALLNFLFLPLIITLGNFNLSLILILFILPLLVWIICICLFLKTNYEHFRIVSILGCLFFIVSFFSSVSNILGNMSIRDIEKLFLPFEYFTKLSSLILIFVIGFAGVVFHIIFSKKLKTELKSIIRTFMLGATISLSIAFFLVIFSFSSFKIIISIYGMLGSLFVIMSAIALLIYMK